MEKHILNIYEGSAVRRIPFKGTVPLIQLLHQHTVAISAPCSGKGNCGGCAVNITGSMLPPDDYEQTVITNRSISGKRLACRAVLTGSCELHMEPPVRLTEIPEGTSFDHNHPVGAAVDIGTTTINAALTDLVSGAIICLVSELNSQRLYGADVMTRISSCENGGLKEMHRAVTEQINGMLCSALNAVAAAGTRIERIAVTGNTTMLHLAAGYDPSPIGTSPYMPYEFLGRHISADVTGLSADAYFMPCVSGFVGGDLIACLIAQELPERHLLCDLGTNGEIALRCDGKYYTSSAAAGPALEGGGIACGSGAVTGAVSRLWEDNGTLCADVIGGGKAKTLCGGAIISAASILLNNGLIESSGRMKNDHYPLIGDTFITDRDIRELQLAKGAVAAAMLRTAEAAGLPPEQIEGIILTGGLGCYADIPGIRHIGLVPQRMANSITARSALALEGARRCLFDEGQKHAAAIAERCVSVALGGDDRFDELFIDNIAFYCDDNENQ